MEEAEVTTVIGLKSAGDEVVKNIVSEVFALPKTLIKLSFGIQTQLLYLTIGCIIKIFNALKNRSIFNRLLGQKKVRKSELVVDQNKVINGARKLQKALFITYDRLHGLDAMAEMDKVVKEIREYRRAVGEGDMKRANAALARLEELDKPYKERTRKSEPRNIPEFEEIYVTDDEDVKTNSETIDNEIGTEDSSVNILKSKSDESTVFSDGKRNFCNKESSKQECGQQNKSSKDSNQENMLLRKRLSKTNSKLEQLLKMSSKLAEQISMLNVHVVWLTSVGDRMSEMQVEIFEGKQMLCEIEEERNEMKKKLSILERMIKEEEEYLDFSGESSYDECETNFVN